MRMKAFMRRCFPLLLCLTLSLCLAPDARAVSCWEYGECGEYAQWRFTEDGELIVYGWGDMANYTKSTVSSTGRNDIRPYSSYILAQDAGNYVVIPRAYKITIENGITSIGDYAFYFFSGVISIDMAGSVQRIGASAFECLPDLQLVEIPEGVSSIGSLAFGACAGLTLVYLPASLTSIDEQAFYGCPEITDVYYAGSAEQWNRINVGSGNDYLTSANIHFGYTSPHTVTYDANGGTGAPASQAKTEGVNLTLSSAKPTHSSVSVGSYTVTLNANGGTVSPTSLTANRSTIYTFKNWNTRADGTGTSYASGATYSTDADVTLYAQWNSSTATSSVTLPTPSRSGYTFIGWGTSSTASTGATGSYTPTGDVTLYAIWEKLPQYIVSYDANGGTGAPAIQTKNPGVSLTISSTQPNRADINDDTYTVTLNANGGKDSPTSLTANRTTTYSFKNWNTKADGTGTSYASGATYSVDADVTLYAQWNSSTATSSLTLPTPSRSGYTFKGWGTSSTATTGVTGNYTPTGNETLYAVWEKIPQYTITYDANGGTGAPDSQKTFVQYGKPQFTIPQTKPTHLDKSAGFYTVSLDPKGGTVSPSSLSAARTTKYKCSYWNTSPNGGGKSYDFGYTYTANEDITLYAQWTPTTSTESVTLPTPVREGYTFKGWTTISDTSYYTEVYGRYGNYTPLQDMTLYAYWEENIVASGKWGLLSWSLNELGELRITGNGAMDNFSYNDTDAWRAFSDQICSVSIQSGITSIGNYAFDHCSKLSSVSIPNSVTSFGAKVFEDCSSLSRIQIPNSIKALHANLFNGCRSLTSVTIPSSVTSVDGAAFNGCSSLIDIFVNESNTVYYDVDGVLFSKQVTALNKPVFLIKYPAGRSGAYVIPTSVGGIGSNAFADCSGLTSVTIPRSVRSIGLLAFSDCSGLTSVEIPDSVTNIDYGAFSDCSGLTSVTIPSSVTSIGRFAFSDCSGLTSVEIPDSVTSIGNYVFRGCSGLTSVTIPSSVTSIAGWAFSGCSSLTSVTIPSSVTSIGDNAFDGCSRLTSVTIPLSVKRIGDNAFAYSGLTSVTIPDSVTSIGDYAFYNCNRLTRVTIPEGVKSIENSTFQYCTSLISVTIPSSVTSIGQYAFFDCSGLTSVEIPSSVTSIAGWAFSGCSSLTSVTIPDSVTSIGEWAFYDCSSLANVTIPSSVTSIDNDAFDGCTSLADIYYEGSEAQWTAISKGEYNDPLTSATIHYNYVILPDPDLTLPASLKTIEEEAFSGDAFIYVKLPEGTECIQARAFGDCPNLRFIYIPESTTTIDQTAFENDTGLTILGKAGSNAENFATANGFAFKVSP